jgi:hypothetical protein
MLMVLPRYLQGSFKASLEWGGYRGLRKGKKMFWSLFIIKHQHFECCVVRCGSNNDTKCSKRHMFKDIELHVQYSRYVQDLIVNKDWMDWNMVINSIAIIRGWLLKIINYCFQVYKCDPLTMLNSLSYFIKKSLTSSIHNIDILSCFIPRFWIWMKSSYMHFNNLRRGQVGDNVIAFSNFQNSRRLTTVGSMLREHFEDGWGHYFTCTGAMD